MVQFLHFLAHQPGATRVLPFHYRQTGNETIEEKEMYYTLSYHELPPILPDEIFMPKRESTRLMTAMTDT